MSKHSGQPTHENTKLLTSGFPHYTRLFSALNRLLHVSVAGKILLWCFLTLAILANLALTNPAVKTQLNKIFSQRLSFFVSEKNARAILGVSDTQASEETSKNISTDTSYLYWMEIIRTHPDYRDGYVMVATLAYQRGDMQEAQKYLNKVREIDPNYPGIPQLTGLLSEE